MVSKAKLYSQLDKLEEELRERIIPHLEHASIGKNDLVFCAKDFNPSPEIGLRADAETESLIQIGTKVLALRDKLGESSEDSIAARICWYCRMWGDTRSKHRKAAQELACDFLQEIM